MFSTIWYWSPNFISGVKTFLFSWRNWGVWTINGHNYSLVIHPINFKIFSPVAFYSSHYTLGWLPLDCGACNFYKCCFFILHWRGTFFCPCTLHILVRISRTVSMPPKDWSVLKYKFKLEYKPKRSTNSVVVKLWAILIKFELKLEYENTSSIPFVFICLHPLTLLLFSLKLWTSASIFPYIRIFNLLILFYFFVQVGVLIEEPFSMLALDELCYMVQRNIEEAIKNEALIQDQVKTKTKRTHAGNGLPASLEHTKTSWKRDVCVHKDFF